MYSAQCIYINIVFQIKWHAWSAQVIQTTFMVKFGVCFSEMCFTEKTSAYGNDKIFISPLLYTHTSCSQSCRHLFHSAGARIILSVAFRETVCNHTHIKRQIEADPLIQRCQYHAMPTQNRQHCLKRWL